MTPLRFITPGLSEIIACGAPAPAAIPAADRGGRHPASHPSRVANEDGFFRFGRVAIFRFDQFEGADGVDVGEGFFPEAAFADVMS